MIKKGTPILCEKCGAHILTATEDILPHAYMASKLFTLPDGTPLPFQAQMICTACRLPFNTIFTDTAKTD